MLSGERTLALVASRDPQVEEPGPDQLYDVGVAGIVALESEAPERFDRDDLEVLAAVARQAALALRTVSALSTTESVLTWNELAISFYRQIGARSMDDWTTFRLTGDPLAQMAGERKKAAT